MEKLHEHKVYIESHKMDMVPYNIAVEALKQAVSQLQNENKVMEKLDKAIATLSAELTSIDPEIEINND